MNTNVCPFLVVLSTYYNEYFLRQTIMFWHFPLIVNTPESIWDNVVYN